MRIHAFLNLLRLRWFAFRRRLGLRMEQNVMIKGPLSHLRLGRGVTLQAGTVIHLGGARWCNQSGHVEIGDHSCISPYCVIYGCGDGGVVIGDHFDCGPHVGIFASRTDYRDPNRKQIFGPVRIGAHVTVFSGAVISSGVTIGDYAVVAANAVVTRDVPAHALVGGAPARVLMSDVAKEATETR